MNTSGSSLLSVSLSHFSLAEVTSCPFVTDDSLPVPSRWAGTSVQEWFQAFRKLGCLASSWSSRVTALTYSLYSGDQHRAGYPLSCHSPNFSIQPKAITNLLSVSTDFSVLNISYEWSDVILWSCGTGLLHLV